MYVVTSFNERPHATRIEGSDPLNTAAWANDEGQREAELTRLTQAHHRLWLPALQTLGARLENQLEAWLDRGAYPVLNDWFGNTRLLAFGTGTPRVAGPSADFQRGLRLPLNIFAISDAR